MNRPPSIILREVKQAIREPWAWPGGYPKFLIMSDGEALSIKAARQCWREIVWATLHRERSGWQAIGVDINWEAVLMCAHTGELIECAYPSETVEC